MQKDHDGSLSELQKMVEEAAERESFMDPQRANPDTSITTGHGKSNPFNIRTARVDKLPMVTPVNKKLNMLSGIQLSIDSQHN